MVPFNNYVIHINNKDDALATLRILDEQGVVCLALCVSKLLYSLGKYFKTSS